ncbi:zinc-binding dehydrogenase [Spirosoma endophyticum]|uniref:NADPH:quinone reductase n=1 Tax=Spirosoma endophyticum TaxID=662367 RepID=A0A1I2CTS6_9BACT|nr:zinc-binding dehydrogenase [Spirosoma endophyticum]SFE71183.1 NADPH:quinone reductase [Spirosoma endophyticum]
MNALTIDRPGSPQTLTLADAPLPQPGNLEVRVNIKAVSLNPADYKLIGGGHPAWTYPHIPGLDAAGIIDTVGQDVTQWKPGDRVAFHANLTKPGVFAEYAIASTLALALIPAAISFEEAASLPCSGLTAMHALEKLHLEPGKKLLILGGSGGVGSLAVQLARLAGLAVLATTSAVNLTYVKELGASHAIDYTTDDVAAEINTVTNGQGIDAIFDTVGHRANPDVFSWLPYSGQLVSIVDVPPLPKNYSSRSLSFHAYALGAVYTYGIVAQQAHFLGASMRNLLDLVDQGKVIPQVTKVINWTDIGLGLEELKEGHVTGKIVATL